MLRLLILILFLLNASVSSGIYAQQSKADSLRTVINPADKSPEMVEAINELGDILVSRGEFNEAKEWFLLALQVAEQLQEERDEARFTTYLNLSSLHLSKEEPDSALVILEAAGEIDLPEDRMNAQRNLKAVALQMSGRLMLASTIFEEAIEVADSLGKDEQAAGLRLNLASLHSSMGEPVEAMRLLYETLIYADQTDHLLMTAIVTNNIGHLFVEMEEYDQAEYYLLKSEEVSRRLGHIVNLRRVYMNLGNLYAGRDQFDLASGYYTEALNITNNSGDRLTAVRVHYNMARMEAKRGNLSKAEEIFNSTLEESRALGSIEGQYNSAISLGDIEKERGNYGAAARWYARAQSTVEGHGFQGMQMDVYQNLYEVYKMAGNSAMALQWLETFSELKERLDSDEKMRLQTEYETLFNIRAREQQAEVIQAKQQKVQARAELQKWLLAFTLSIGGFLFIVAFVLNRSNRKVREFNAELEQSNRKILEANKTVQEKNRELEQVNQVKNKLFAIVAHDLRGPLSSLQSLIYLLREHELTKSELNNILDSLDQNIQENATMMDNLLAWAKAQMNGIQLNERDFDLNEAAKAVIDQIRFQAGHKDVELKLQMFGGLYVEADYDLVKLIIRNLVANAIKFSEKGDTVTLSAVQDGNFVEIRVADEGMGIKPEDQTKLFTSEHFSTRGTKNEKGSGLGLNLSREFVVEHGGEMWFESVYGEGTTFYFTLPRAAEDSDIERSGRGEKAEEFSH
ncbi:ATP-binding protein [Rhodohalobacter halophilus]|uniref:ATP-binding protein n=1 Tax=Rhodohalobacter halophilus TaxID=1812810 RepID=UPI00083FC197|nr:tetratricopeptide repeat protein [Rhodohalobacter halophilus]